MTVNAKQVNGRRTLRYETYEDLLADVNELASGETDVVGNWSLAQVCKHLAEAFNGCIDGVSFRAPWPMRVMAKLLMKKRFLSATIPAGFQIPGSDPQRFVRLKYGVLNNAP